MQRRFVSDVSHELRTPLTTIKLAGESIFSQRASLDPNLARSAELMQSQIDRFEGLLSDLLEISRYDAGAVVPELELTDVKSVVRSAVSSLEPLAASKQVKIEVKAPREPIEAELDFRRIERLLRNLISNAVEHSDSEPVRVHIGSNTEAIAISVTDRGPGMSDEQLSHVFDRFWRADPARKRSTGGTGLGLSIAKEDAAVHRGWLQVWSEPGRGSSFRLTLPRRRDYNVIDSPLKLPPAELAKAKKATSRSKS
jgi:two-component system sensor histidine kinase MtrB